MMYSKFVSFMQKTSTGQSDRWRFSAVICYLLLAARREFRFIPRLRLSACGAAARAAAATAATGRSVEQTTDVTDEVRYGDDDDDSDNNRCRTHTRTPLSIGSNCLCTEAGHKG